MSKVSRNLNRRNGNKENSKPEWNNSEEELFQVQRGGGIKVSTNVAVESKLRTRDGEGAAEYYKFPEQKRGLDSPV